MDYLRTLSRLLSFLWSDIKKKEVRFQYSSKIVSLFPGNFGSYLRYLLLKKKLKHIGNNVHFWGSYVIFSANELSIGDNVGFAREINIQAAGGVSIGNNCVFGPFVKIWSRDHAYTDPQITINDQGYVMRPVVIGNDVWIGSDVFIMPGVELGDGCVVSAGSVVGAKKYPAYSILAGNPARKIGSREQDQKIPTQP